MAVLKIVDNHSLTLLKIPHKILINNILIGIIRSKSVRILLPEGRFSVTIQSMVPILSATKTIELGENETLQLSFRDRERIWDVLFCIDLVLWLVKIFLDAFDFWTIYSIPVYWSTVYEIFTNGYFVVWLIYEWLIRKKYFKIETSPISED